MDWVWSVRKKEESGMSCRFLEEPVADIGSTGRSPNLGER